MFFFDCDKGYVPDNGQNDVTDGTVENYDFDWNEPTRPDSIDRDTGSESPGSGDAPETGTQT